VKTCKGGLSFEIGFLVNKMVVNMIIEDGKFYFINNDFIEKYGAKHKLMSNKETGTNRPCYFCFRDKENIEII